MFGIDFQNFSLWVNLGIFALGAGVVWIAGTYVSRFADTVAKRTGLGSAFVGLLLLGIITDSPEIGTTATAAALGDAELALNNIFGGVVLQTAIIAFLDLFFVRGALTYFAPNSVLLVEGSLLVALLGLMLAVASAGEPLAILGVGLGAILLLATYVLSLYLSSQYERHERWRPADGGEERVEEKKEERERAEKYIEWPMGRLIGVFAIGAIIIFSAGSILAQTAEALATQTGLGASFIGATLLALSTSLPEVSTTVSAVRLGNVDMAVSNIFGSNAVMAALLFLADIFYREGPIMDEMNSAARFSLAMGVLLTAVYLVGLLQRRKRTVVGMGYDSAFVWLLLLVGLYVQYTLR